MSDPCDCSYCRLVERSPCDADMIAARGRLIEAIAGSLGVPPAVATLRVTGMTAPLDSIACR